LLFWTILESYKLENNVEIPIYNHKNQQKQHKKIIFSIFRTNLDCKY